MSLGTSFSFNNVKEISLVKMTTASDKGNFEHQGEINQICCRFQRKSHSN